MSAIIESLLVTTAMAVVESTLSMEGGIGCFELKV
jgi:hypothetical protein